MTARDDKTQRAPARRDLFAHPAVRNYLLFCLTALFLLVLCLADRGLEWWGLVPALIGCLTLLTRWSHGPPLVLALLAGLLGMPGSRTGGPRAAWSRFQVPTLMDLVLCVAVLAYVMGHYRLLSLVRSIFPAGVDHRHGGGDATRRRSVDLVTAWEMAWLGLSLAVCVGLAVSLWMWMLEGVPPLGIPRDLWRVLRLVWAVLALVAAAGILTSYLRLVTATPEESFLYLQDQCWRHTRREQSSLNRWLTWARLRAGRKKETS